MRKLAWLLLALGVAAVTASLGAWQLRRAEFKLALQAVQQRAAALPPLASLQGAQEHRRATLQGVWQARHQVWLANRSQGGQAGFVLLTPLQLHDGRWLWVQRGFHPRSQAGFAAPPWPPTPAGEVSVAGRLAREASRSFDLGEAGQGAVRQNLEPAQPPVPGVAMAPWVLWQLVDCAPLRCDWPAPDSGVAKHHGYAAQWFALAVLSLVLYAWFQVLPRRRARR